MAQWRGLNVDTVSMDGSKLRFHSRRFAAFNLSGAPVWEGGKHTVMVFCYRSIYVFQSEEMHCASPAAKLTIRDLSTVYSFHANKGGRLLDYRRSY